MNDLFFIEIRHSQYGDYGRAIFARRVISRSYDLTAEQYWRIRKVAQRITLESDGFAVLIWPAPKRQPCGHPVTAIESGDTE